VTQGNLMANGNRVLRLFVGMGLLAMPALPNDTFVHESAGNLMFVQNNDVMIQRERLVIGPPVQSSSTPLWTIPIHVEYDLRNTSAKQIQGHIGFPLAACSLGDYVSAKHMSFLSGSAATCVKEPTMTLNVDRHSVAGRWDFVFLRDGMPLGTGLPDTNLHTKVAALINLVHDPNEKFYKEDPTFLKAAKELCVQLGGQIKGADCKAFARISVHRTFLWEHTFAPRGSVHVVHDYPVSASWNLHPADVFSYDAFCLGDSSTHSVWTKYLEDLQQKQAAGIVNDNYPYPREFFTEYVLRTGALWAGPIKDFELVIRKSSPAQLISTCFSGLTKAGSLEFRAHRVDFKPAEDLRVLYLRPADDK
jgi:Domain of unknown function (DUF4424)